MAILATQQHLRTTVTFTALLKIQSSVVRLSQKYTPVSSLSTRQRSSHPLCSQEGLRCADTALTPWKGGDAPLHLKLVRVPPKRIGSLTHVTLCFILYQVMSALSLQGRPGQGIFPSLFTRRNLTPSSSWKHCRLFLSSTCRWKDQFLPLDGKKTRRSVHVWLNWLFI